MVCGAAVPAVAVPAGRAAAGHLVFRHRSSCGRGDAGHRALDEHGFPGDAARPVARRHRPCFSYAARQQRNQELRGTGNKTCQGNRRAFRHARDLPDGSAFIRWASTRGGHKRHRSGAGTKERRSATTHCCGKAGLFPGRGRHRRAAGWQAARRRMEGLAGRLRDAYQSAGAIDALRTDATNTAFSGCRSFRFGLLRLRRELVFHESGGSAGAFRRGGRRQRSGVSPVSAGTRGRNCGAGSESRGAGFRALRLEKLVTAIFMGLITFVAGLNILVVLSMTVTDKARDIAVLRSMGARGKQIRTIFLWQGISIGAAGTLLGLFIGYGFSFVAGNYHLIPLDPQIYAVPYVPFHPSIFDGVWITTVAMGISIGATVLPARAAVRLLPVEILRYE